MRIAIVSESPADEAAIKFLVDAVVGHETELVSAPRLRPGGWSHVLALLPTIVKALHYYTDAEALVVVVDSDESPVHTAAHQMLGNDNPDCRLCLMRACIELSLHRVAPVANRIALRTAVGVAVPSIEAWYQCGVDPHVNEATWARKLAGENINYSKQSLKEAVYGSDQPSLAMETNAAVEAARLLTNRLDLLQQLFPNGCGPLLRSIRAWSDQTP